VARPRARPPSTTGGWCPIPVKEHSKATSLLQLAPYLKRRATKEELDAWTWGGVGIVTEPLSGLLVLDVDGPRGEVKLKELGNPLMPMVRTAGGTIFVLQAPWRGRPHRDPGRTRARRESRRRLRRSIPSLGANGRRYE
jgi:hypothetical protein